MELKKPQHTESLFNAGIALLERIDAIKKASHTFFLAQDWRAYTHVLISFRMEINQFLDDDERKKADELQTAALNELNKMRTKDMYTNLEPFIKLFTWLTDKEHKYGLSMPGKRPDTDAAEV